MLKLPTLGEMDRASDVRIFLCTSPTDMRRGFDRLAETVRSSLCQDPLDGSLFVFRSRSGDRLKILYWDKDGFCLWYKRLEEGTFRFPAAQAGVGRGDHLRPEPVQRPVRLRQRRRPGHR